MSQDENDPLKRQVTSKELFATIFVVLWFFLSIFVLTEHPVVGGVMIVGFFAVALSVFLIEQRSMTDEQKQPFRLAAEMFYNNPVVRLSDFLRKVIIVFVILYIAYAVYSGAV